jgi:uracil-DNA glycosylase family 4
MKHRSARRVTAQWERLNARIVRCGACPRLRAYCQHVARERKTAYRHDPYWGKPVPNFGDPNARLLIVGLAPAAHGGNRTGRLFTGDRSGEWLMRALYRVGFANQPTSTHRDDGLRLIDCAITAVCHCTPPGNRPTRAELQRCHGWLSQTLDLVPARVFLALGQIAWTELLRELRRRGWLAAKPVHFFHGAELLLVGQRFALASYHPSQQNTFTGRLREGMLERVLRRARQLLEEEDLHLEMNPQREGLCDR